METPPAFPTLEPGSRLWCSPGSAIIRQHNDNTSDTDESVANCSGFFCLDAFFFIHRSATGGSSELLLSVPVPVVAVCRSIPFSIAGTDMPVHFSDAVSLRQS
jgi:hypothetical protein